MQSVTWATELMEDLVGEVEAGLRFGTYGSASAAIAMEVVSTEAKMNSVDNIVGNCMVDLWNFGPHCRRKMVTVKRFITRCVRKTIAVVLLLQRCTKFSTVIAPSQHEPVTVEREIKQTTKKQRKHLSALWKLQRVLQVASSLHGLYVFGKLGKFPTLHTPTYIACAR